MTTRLPGPDQPNNSFDRLEAADRRQSVIAAMWPSLAAFFAVATFVAVVEWLTRPQHRFAIVIVGTLYVFIAATCVFAVRRWPERAVAIAVLGVSAFCAAMLSYSPMVQGSGELCVLAIVVLLGGFSAGFPLGLRSQLAASIVPLVGYAVVLQIGTRTAFPAWYSASGLVFFLFVLAIGARTSDRNRARILRDSHRQGLLAAENARLRDEARAADRAKTDLLSILSHELRAPLNNVRMLADLAADGARTNADDLEESLRMICAESQRANDMVHTMLEFGSIETGELRLRIEEFDVGDMVCKLREDLPATWTAPGVEVVWPELPAPVVVRTDRGKLEAIVRNLLHNALKHTQSGIVRVETSADSGSVAIAVDDTGDGIPSEAVPHIFDRFARVGDDRRGFGLGLYIVKRFSEVLGGTVHVQSVSGAGSRFEVLVPRTLTVATSAESQAA